MRVPKRAHTLRGREGRRVHRQMQLPKLVEMRTLAHVLHVLHEVEF